MAETAFEAVTMSATVIPGTKGASNPAACCCTHSHPASAWAVAP